MTKGWKKKPFKARKPRRAVPKGQSTAMLAWRALTNNRLQQLEENILSIMMGNMPQVKVLKVRPEAYLAEEE